MACWRVIPIYVKACVYYLVLFAIAKTLKRKECLTLVSHFLKIKNVELRGKSRWLGAWERGLWSLDWSNAVANFVLYVFRTTRALLRCEVWFSHVRMGWRSLIFPCEMDWRSLISYGALVGLSARAYCSCPFACTDHCLSTVITTLTFMLCLLSALLICSTVADTLEWVVQQAGVHNTFHLWFACPDVLPQCGYGLHTLKHVSWNLYRNAAGQGQNRGPWCISQSSTLKSTLLQWCFAS